MKLTGKAKEDFEKWINIVYIISDYQNITEEIFLNALIIEWFDNVGIYVDVGGIDYRGLEYWYNIQQPKTLNGENGEYFDSRQEATEKAIEKANEIYNTK